MRFCRFALVGLVALSCGSGGRKTSAWTAGPRTFPSLFAAWSPAQDLNPLPNGPETALTESLTTDLARHDLVWQGIQAWGLQSADGGYAGEAEAFSPQTVQTALATTAALRALNPNIRLLAEIRYHSAQTTYLPPDLPWWLRAADGGLVSSGGSYDLLDFHQPGLQAQAGHLCAIVMQTGALDGCFLDWWNGNSEPGGGLSDCVALVQNVRAALGDAGLLVVNVNGNFPPSETAAYINGLYMEGYNSSFFPLSSWQQGAQIMAWAEDGTGNLVSPSFTAFEGWYPAPADGGFSTAGRSDYPLVRWTTALSLVFSDGYVLFGDPDGYPNGDHHHDIYTPLWSDAQGDRPLGKPLGPPIALDGAQPDGTFRREFSQGTVILNPPDGSPVTVTFSSARQSLGWGTQAATFSIAPGDGDVFLQPAP